MRTFERTMNARKILNARKSGHRHFPSGTVWTYRLSVWHLNLRIFYLEHCGIALYDYSYTFCLRRKTVSSKSHTFPGGVLFPPALFTALFTNNFLLLTMLFLKCNEQSRRVYSASAMVNNWVKFL